MLNILIPGLILALLSPPSEIEGFYTKGRIIHATGLPDSGPGFLHLFRPRDRGWGSSKLVALLEGSAHFVQEEFPESGVLQIGDTSARSGGYVSGHSSHQNGLDADIAFLRTDLDTQDPGAVDGFTQDFLQSDGALSPIFDLARNYALVRWWSDTGVLNRIFVDAKIKAAFCARAEEEGLDLEKQDFLRRLRPWPHHSDHLHVRIQCPSESPKCVAQAEPPEGSGCADALRIANGDLQWTADPSEVDPDGGP